MWSEFPLRSKIALDNWRSGFLVVPCLMTAGGMALAFVASLFDDTEFVRALARDGWIFHGGQESATVILATIAGSVISLAGTTFAMTMAILTFASSQFGPRLLRNFRRDTRNQVVLGAYAATFGYCLIVLRNIGYSSGEALGPATAFPYASIAVAMLAAIACVILLIYFIHFTAMSIHAPRVVASISHELLRSIRRLYPGNLGSEPPADRRADPSVDVPTDFDAEAGAVVCSARGYVQALDAAGLIGLTKREDVIVRLACAPGDYVAPGDVIATVWPASRASTSMARSLNALVIVGPERTQFQDIEYHLLQLVEIGSRALSPGINDPFTAVQCVDRLADAMCVFARMDVPSAYRYDESGRLRVITSEVQTLEQLTSICFDDIRIYGQGHIDVVLRLLVGLASIGVRTSLDPDRAMLRRHADAIERGAVRAGMDEVDIERIRVQYRKTLESLGASL
jgi:uncharacterized membrane protein